MYQEFIYYAYSFYTYLFEEQALSPFRSGWVESLGDIARYRIAVSSMLEKSTKSSTAAVNAITTAALRDSRLLPTPAPTPDVSALSDKNASPMPAVSQEHVMREGSSQPSVGHEPQPADPRVPGVNIPSVGVAAARLMVLEPERERWRQISRDWYLKGLTFMPGSGKLHHHLGILSSREAENVEKEEMRAVYHFMKR